MKKVICILFFTFLAGHGITYAQVFREGSSILHAGIGLGSPFVYKNSNINVPPIHASLEFGVRDKIGLGAMVGYTSSGDQNWEFSYIIAGLRGSYHFIDHDKADLYAGLLMGYNAASAGPANGDGNGSGPDAGGFALGIYAGGRYMFNKKIGAFAELGYNISWVSLGACAKFK